MSRDPLALENQLCFPLYAAAKAVVGRYTPFLDAIGLTYTQYITMMVLWERRKVSVKALGERLYLDSGTLTPLLKRLEGKGLVRRERSREDERVVHIAVTPAGERLRAAAADIPRRVGACIALDGGDVAALYKLLYKLLGCLGDG